MLAKADAASVIPEISPAARNAILGILIGEVAAGFEILLPNGHDQTRLLWLFKMLPGRKTQIEAVLDELLRAGLTEEYERAWEEDTVALTALGVSWASVHLEMPVWSREVGREHFQDFCGRLYDWIKRVPCDEFRGKRGMRIAMVDGPLPE